MDRTGPRRRIGPAAIVVVAAVLAAGAIYWLTHSHASGVAGRTVTDLAGREVTVPNKVRRLIALGPGALRLVTYLGATDRVVGIEDFERRMSRDVYLRPYASTLGEAFLDLPVVGTGGPGALPDPEKILICRPDLIVAVGMEPAQLANIEAKTGVPAVYLSYGELGAWRQAAQRSLSLLGEVLDRSERAAALNRYVASLEEDLKKRTADIDRADRPTAYFGGISFKGTHGLTSTQAGYCPGLLVGARNLADGLGKTGHFYVDKEQILAWNPDFIFVDTGSRVILDQDFRKNRDFYRLLKAARAGRVRSLLAYNYYNTNIELALLNAYFIGKSMYPARFDDVSMEDKAGEIMEAFLGVRPAGDLPAYRALGFPAAGPVKWK